MGKHVDSLLPAGKSWKLVWHDEFDGDTLDRTKWTSACIFYSRGMRRSPTKERNWTARATCV